MTGLFSNALERMDGDLFGPASFSEYKRSVGKPSADTCASISIDSLTRLPKELRDAGAMVLRLGGTPENRSKTAFALVKSPHSVEDFFLVDDQVFTKKQGTTFLPCVSVRSLFPFFVLPKLTEIAKVNLALASGLLGQALKLDQPWPLSAPATTSTKYTFQFAPHPKLDVTLNHNQGQVEIDAFFVGQRKGKDCAFILEAKDGAGCSLAKHKLAYPWFGLRPGIPDDMPLVPVYLRTQDVGMRIQFDVVECAFTSESLVGLEAVSHSRLVLPKLAM